MPVLVFLFGVALQCALVAARAFALTLVVPHIGHGLSIDFWPAAALVVAVDVLFGLKAGGVASSSSKEA